LDLPGIDAILLKNQFQYPSFHSIYNIPNLKCGLIPIYRLKMFILLPKEDSSVTEYVWICLNEEALDIRNPFLKTQISPAVLKLIQPLLFSPSLLLK
jgi:hypothetical protein